MKSIPKTPKPVLFGLCFLGLWVQQNSAQPSLDSETGLIERPGSQPVIEFTGAITTTSNGTEAYLDFEQLSLFEQHEIVLGTPWMDEPTRYSGPLLKDVLSFLGVENKSVTITAYDNYSATIPPSDLEEHTVLLAIKREGKPFRVKDFGPFRIVYPLSDMPSLEHRKLWARSIYQIKRIRVN